MIFQPMKAIVRVERVFVLDPNGVDTLWFDLRLDPPLNAADRKTVKTYLQKVLAPQAAEIRKNKPFMADLADETKRSAKVTIEDVCKVLSPRISARGRMLDKRAITHAEGDNIRMEQLDDSTTGNLARYALRRSEQLLGIDRTPASHTAA